jgi:hypothetical protein
VVGQQVLDRARAHAGQGLLGLVVLALLAQGEGLLAARAVVRLHALDLLLQLGDRGQRGIALQQTLVRRQGALQVARLSWARAVASRMSCSFSFLLGRHLLALIGAGRTTQAHFLLQLVDAELEGVRLGGGGGSSSWSGNRSSRSSRRSSSMSDSSGRRPARRGPWPSAQAAGELPRRSVVSGVAGARRRAVRQLERLVEAQQRIAEAAGLLGLAVLLGPVVEGWRWSSAYERSSVLRSSAMRAGGRTELGSSWARASLGLGLEAHDPALRVAVVVELDHGHQRQAEAGREADRDAPAAAPSSAPARPAPARAARGSSGARA